MPIPIGPLPVDSLEEKPDTGSPDRTGAGSHLRYAPPPSGMLREECYATDPVIPLWGTGVRPDKNRSPRAVRGAGSRLPPTLRSAPFPLRGPSAGMLREGCLPYGYDVAKPIR